MRLECMHYVISLRRLSHGTTLPAYKPCQPDFNLQLGKHMQTLYNRSPESLRHTIKTTNTRLQPRAFKMPLVVPGVTADNMGDDKTQEWMNKLAGKTLCDGPSSETTFCKADLPKETRVIEPGSMVTKDFKPDRLNVHVKEDGTVSHVTHG
ncbi:hypothetical protein VTI74DRAFT_4602 [Chaetomium olivicolor]